MWCQLYIMNTVYETVETLQVVVNRWLVVYKVMMDSANRNFTQLPAILQSKIFYLSDKLSNIFIK